MLQKRRAIAVLIVVGIFAIGLGAVFGWQHLFGATANDDNEFANLACGRGIKIKNAAAYGSAPHSLAVFVQDNDSYTADRISDSNSQDTTLFEAQRSHEVSEVQMVACVDRVDAESTGQKCDFDGGKSLAVYKPQYRVRVYEARTHKVLTDKTVGADSQFTCPTMHFDPGDHKIYIGPDKSALTPIIEPLVG